ncbi:MAG TPA: hypothetical protein VLA95_01180 [Gemmatimonadales bacterium]|nr:hypothetical protein [Gemmatimonadales bacterium]
MSRAPAACALALCLALLPAEPASAQQVPWTVRYGKFVALALAGLGVWQAQDHHQQAEDAYDALEERCREQPSACIIGPGGYPDPVSEQLYQTALSEDDKARAWLIGAEVSLVGAVALFVYEITRPSGPERDDIPFEPLVDPRAGLVGARLRVF